MHQFWLAGVVAVGLMLSACAGELSQGPGPGGDSRASDGAAGDALADGGADSRGVGDGTTSDGGAGDGAADDVVSSDGGGDGPPACPEGATRALPCVVRHGSGERTEICRDRTWSSLDDCAIVACDVDYHPQGGACIQWPPATVFEVAPSAMRANQLQFSVETALTAVEYAIVSVDAGGISSSTPTHAQLDAATGSFIWTPTPSQVGEYTFVFEGKDAAAATERVTVHVIVTTPPICTASSSTCAFLKAKWEAGEAAGHLGNWYHNCDGFHTRVNMAHYPQLDLIESSGCRTETASDPNRVRLGNESCATTSGDNWGSIPRGLLTSQDMADRIYSQYRNNDFYWYPEHRDHDDVDYFHAKVPFMNVSQGSSGSEMDEVSNFLNILAAFKPAVKRRLVAETLLMPTVQMVFRRAREPSDTAYLTGEAHPSAFDNLNASQGMVELANSIDLEDIPPMVQLRVVEETYTVIEGKREQWFTTPVSICRIHRDTAYTKRIVISAEDSYDPNGRALSFDWVVLRGDTDHVRITPRNAAGSVVQIEIDYHDKTTIGVGPRLTNMVEVGAFVHNGVHYSAPAFVTSYTLDNEQRVYDAEGDLSSVTPNGNYVYPRLL